MNLVDALRLVELIRHIMTLLCLIDRAKSSDEFVFVFLA